MAELGSAFIAGATGIDTDLEQSSAYVASWLQALRDDKKLVVQAAQQAQRAVDRILGAEPVSSEQAT